jgi:hypothetical protein
MKRKQYKLITFGQNSVLVHYRWVLLGYPLTQWQRCSDAIQNVRSIRAIAKKLKLSRITINL